MEAYLPKVWERSYELIQIKIKLHNAVVFKILVKVLSTEWLPW